MSLSSKLEQNASKSAGDNAPNSSKWKDFPPPVVANMDGSGLFWRSPSFLLSLSRFSKRVAMTSYVLFIASSRPTRLNLASLLDNYKRISWGHNKSWFVLSMIPLCVLQGRQGPSLTFPGKQCYRE